METRHLFIINPIAGGSDSTGRLRPLIDDAEAQTGETCLVLTTQYAGHAPVLARETVLSAPDVNWRVYACGGDGTLTELVRSLAGLNNVALTSVPCGTGNDFVRIFSDTARFLDIKSLMQGETVPFDLVKAEVTAPDGTRSQYHAINISSVGLDARTAAGMRRFHWARRLGAGAAYNLSLIYNLIRGLHEPYEIIMENEVFDENFTLMAICNGRYYGGGYYVMPYAEPCDGALDFLFIRKVGRLTVAGLIKEYFSGNFEKLGDLHIYRRGERAEIICGKPQHINLDGESVYAKSVVFSVSEHKMNFIVPLGTGFTADFPAR